MKLAKYENNSDWFVISDCGRRYELATVHSIKSNNFYDIVIIFDFDDDNEDDKDMKVVDFFYGASEFINNPESALNFIKKSISKYEMDKGCIDNKANIEIIKEF